MKKLILLFAIVMLLNIPLIADAAEKPIEVYVNGKGIEFTVDPIQESGTTMVQFRPIFEALGLSIEWDQKTKTITGTRGELTIKLTIGAKVAYVNDDEQNLAVAPKTIQGNTLIPLRFVGEATGSKVSWDNNNRVIQIDKQMIFNQNKLVDNGEDSDKLVIVFVGDGYTKDEQDKFNADAQKMVNAFLNEEPFKSLSERINFYSINVISNVSGASLDPDHIQDTFFGSAYNTNGIDRLLVPTKNNALASVLSGSNIDYDSAVVIVNSDIYGGSGGRYPTASVNSSSMEIMLHEFGHSYAGLGDEYYAGEQYTNEAPNVTTESNPEMVKWNSYIGQSKIGVYPMSDVKGWYIPSLACKMRLLGNPFCAVCEDIIKKKIFSEAEKSKAA